MEPSVQLSAFNCPHCGAHAHQIWQRVAAHPLDGDQKLPVFVCESQEYELGATFISAWRVNNFGFVVENLSISRCNHCNKIGVWILDDLVYPHLKSGPQPNPDLPDEIKADYEEARSIVTLSPRGSAALLRLAVQKLCKHLGEKGKRIDDDIAALVEKGLDKLVQQALDTLRVVGNEAVHPGELDLKDDRETALALFGLLNEIVEQLITKPKRIQEMYQKLPASKLEGIAKRDSKSDRPEQA